MVWPRREEPWWLDRQGALTGGCRTELDASSEDSELRLAFDLDAVLTRRVSVGLSYSNSIPLVSSTPKAPPVTPMTPATMSCRASVSPRVKIDVAVETYKKQERGKLVHDE
jgi:hypothetical protein